MFLNKIILTHENDDDGKEYGDGSHCKTDE